MTAANARIPVGNDNDPIIKVGNFGPVDDGSENIAIVLRGGIVESVHCGHIASVSGMCQESLNRGNPHITIYPTSLLNPLRLVGMLKAGLDLPDHQIALACSTQLHSTEDLREVEKIVTQAGLTTEDFHAATKSSFRGGSNRSRFSGMCAGEHAAMIATCVAAKWNPEAYLAPNHPLQQAIHSAVSVLAGDQTGTAIDLCGAPLFATTLAGLASAWSRIALSKLGTPEFRVANAMRTYPRLVSGSRNYQACLMEAVPGLIANHGVGTFVAAMHTGESVAVRINDASPRPIPVIIDSAISNIGIESSAIERHRALVAEFSSSGPDADGSAILFC